MNKEIIGQLIEQNIYGILEYENNSNIITKCKKQIQYAYKNVKLLNRYPHENVKL